RQPRRALRTNIAQVLVQKVLDTAIAGAQPVPQLPVFLVVVAQQGPGDFQKVGAGGAPADRLPQRGELEIDVAVQLFVALRETLLVSRCTHTYPPCGQSGLKRDAR